MNLKYIIYNRKINKQRLFSNFLYFNHLTLTKIRG